MLLFLLACPAIDDQEHAERFDLDGDGVPWPEDCDDADPQVSPEADEICDDGLDNDCDEDPRDCQLEGELGVGEASWTADGSADSYLGWSLATADLDRDGAPDLAAGAPNLDQVYVYLGPVEGADWTFEGPEGSAFGIDLAAVEGWVAVGAPGLDRVYTYEDGVEVGLVDLWQVDASSGFSVALDAQQTLALSAPMTSEERGEVYLVQPPLVDELQVGGRVIGEPGERIGNHVALADLDGDGASELLFSSTTASDFAGQVWACPGSELELSTLDCDSLALGEEADYLGARLELDDLDQDGHVDLIVGVSGYDGGLGAVAFFPGPLDGERLLDDAQALMLGAASGDRMGSGLALVDLDGDGASEVLTGSLGASTSQPGRAALHEAPFEGLMDYEQSRLRIEGPRETGFGFSLAGGELNGEGRADLVVAAPLVDEATGRIWLFRGEDI